MADLPRSARSITATELRKCAESADGRRGRQLRLVYLVPAGRALDNGEYVMLAPEDEQPPETTAVYEVVTTRSGWTRPAHEHEDLTEVTIKPAGLAPVPLKPGSHDALFWTESAVQKFMFPYYARHLTKDQYDLMYETYMGINADGTAKDRTPVALSHLPTSDYDDAGMFVGVPPHVVAKLGMLSTIGVIVGNDDPVPLPLYLFSTAGPNAFDRLL